MPDLTQAERNAVEFGRHVKAGEGWALGLLVAASVQPGLDGQGGDRRSDHRADRRGDRSGKISLAGYAEKSGIGEHRVKRYWDGWSRAAAAGVVRAAGELTPADAHDAALLPTGSYWPQFYDGRAEAGRNIKSVARRDALEAEAERQEVGPTKVLDVVSNVRAAAAAMSVDREFAETLIGALATGPVAAQLSDEAAQTLRTAYDRTPPGQALRRAMTTVEARHAERSERAEHQGQPLTVRIRVLGMTVRMLATHGRWPEVEAAYVSFREVTEEIAGLIAEHEATSDPEWDQL
jgi:hypothetical protein